MKLDLYKPVIIETNISYECVPLDAENINIYIKWLKSDKGSYTPCKIIKSKVYGNIVQVNTKKEAKEQLKNAEALFLKVNGENHPTPNQIIEQMDELMMNVNACSDYDFTNNEISWYETYGNVTELLDNFFNNCLNDIRTPEMYDCSTEFVNKKQRVIDYNNDIVPIQVTVRNFKGHPTQITIMENYTLRQIFEMIKRASSSRISGDFIAELVNEWYIQKEYCTNDFIFDFAILLIGKSRRIFDLQFATVLNHNAQNILIGKSLPKEVKDLLHQNGDNYIYATKTEEDDGVKIVWLYIETVDGIIKDMFSGIIPTQEPIVGSFYYLEGTNEHKQFYNQLMNDIEIAKNKKQQ